jgi:hypothetical protein
MERQHEEDQSEPMPETPHPGPSATPEQWSEAMAARAAAIRGLMEGRYHPADGRAVPQWVRDAYFEARKRAECDQPCSN